MAATHGRAASADSDDRATAPQKAARAPGTPSQRILSRSTLPNRQWEAAEKAEVPTSAMWMAADARAGASPTPSSRVDVLTPQASSRDPSTCWATKQWAISTMQLGSDIHL